MGIKLDNVPVFDDNILGEYNEIAGNLNGIQEEIYDFFENRKDDNIIFDENDHEYNMDFSDSSLLQDDLVDYEEQLEKGEIDLESFNQIKKFYSEVDDKEEKAKEINIAFAQSLQKLFNLIGQLKKSIDEKMINESVYFFRSNIEYIIKEKGKMFDVIKSNSNIDLKEIDKSPYLYIFNTLTKEAQRIAKSYEIAMLEENIYERLKMLGGIDFSDLNLVAKFEDTIEKHDLNLGNIEMLIYYNHMFEVNTKNMGNNISYTRLIGYKQKLLEILKLNINKLLYDLNINLDDFTHNQFIEHLYLVKEKLESDIILLGKATTKYDKELLKFPNLSNIIKIYNIIRLKRNREIDYINSLVEEINSIDSSKISRKDKYKAREELDKIFNSGNMY